MYEDRQVPENSADPDQTAPQEQSYQSLHCLSFHLHLLDSFLHCITTIIHFYEMYSSNFRCPNFHNFYSTWPNLRTENSISEMTQVSHYHLKFVKAAFLIFETEFIGSENIQFHIHLTLLHSERPNLCKLYFKYSRLNLLAQEIYNFTHI